MASKLANQFVASLYYINKHHDLQTLRPGDVVRQEKKPEGDIDTGEREGDEAYLLSTLTHLTDIPLVETHPVDVFKAGQKELAQDLILKEQQIEYLISVLPGLENSEKDQEQTIRQLEEELKAAESRRKEALLEKQATLAKLEKVIRSVKRP